MLWADVLMTNCLPGHVRLTPRYDVVNNRSGERSVRMGEIGNTGGGKSKQTFFTVRIIADLEIENKQKLFL